MIIKYPVLMLRITPANFERHIGEEGFGHFPLANYNSVNLKEFIREAFPNGTPALDPDMPTWNVADLTWDGSTPQPELWELVDEMEWFLHGFCRGVVESRHLNGSRSLASERSNAAQWQSFGWEISVRVAFSDLQFLFGASRWSVSLREKAKQARPRGANGRFQKQPENADWDMIPRDFRLSPNSLVSDSSDEPLPSSS